MDLIDREQLMDYIRSRKINIGKLAHDVIMKQPSIQPQEPCEDAISRQACLYVLTGGDVEKQFPKINETLKEIINSIPPLKPAEPQTGHWKRIGYDIYECSICGQDVMTGDICAYRYCHCCGTKMESGG